MGVGPRIVHAVGVLPLGSTAGAEAPVAGRGQHLAQALRLRVEALVGERKFVYRDSSDGRWIRRRQALQRAEAVSNPSALAPLAKSGVPRAALRPQR
jgi:hypothetical protein